MSVRKATAKWEGTLKEGNGVMRLDSGAYEGPFTWASRFSDGKGTNPEELIGAALAGCYSMFLSALLTGNKTPPTSVETEASVTLADGPTITNIDLVCNAVVPDISPEKFQELVASAKEKCPVSKALAGPEISVTATLK